MGCNCYYIYSPSGASMFEVQHFILCSPCSWGQKYFSWFLVTITDFQIQTASSGGCVHITNSHTNRSSSSKLADITTTLLKSSLQPLSVPTYRWAWELYNQFSAAVFKSALVHLPISSSDLSLFITYMFEHLITQHLQQILMFLRWAIVIN